ncbi:MULTISPECIES: hypothetical protein [Halobaculum]|uniref:Uncharacterized protein n=2 Tax=Halobaculum TaxID=43927 RepID=A0A8T8WEU1_9EURY|nr:MULTISPECIES: hypothetical protein [Halobaculum]QZP38365.1 hypothetical protein K6T50_04270 [Halobaculum magnesiiphilum]QZY03353.1 hypothetical protein K6T36_04055 [Halobaculum roseum]
MDEVLEAAEVVADSELEGAVVWLFRVIGILLALAGVGLWLFTQSGLLWLPAILIAVGVLLAVIPGVLLELTELFA